MIQYYCKQNKNEKSLTHGKWYAYPKAMSTIDLEGLASHMTEHNTPFSKGTIYGVLCDMVKCIKEQLLAGNNVKIDDLAIFSVGIRNSRGGAESEEEFNTNKNIEGVKLRARATGDLSPTLLNLDASLKKVTAAGSTTSSGSNGNETTDPNGPGNGSEGGDDLVG
jgi:predicted histone-like DNA-binding protein